jgi:hypothetical protein
MKKLVAFGAVFALAACATVREEDTAAWQGKPVSMLEQHPVFLTMRLVKTKTSDGTEIWNYVNGRSVTSCSGDATASLNYLSQVQYSAFQSCMSNVAACNNIFYVKNAVVQRYVPVGTGGARCFTDKRAQPDFAGPTNYR